MKFVVDNMLGRLAKYLRFLGYDTLYFFEDKGDDYIIKIAREENRIIITRDRELYARAKRLGVEAVLIDDVDLKRQLAYLKKILCLTAENMFSLCSLCNGPIRNINSEEVKGKIPDRILETTDQFYVCTRCGKIYWYGSHTADIERRVLEVMKNETREEEQGL